MHAFKDQVTEIISVLDDAHSKIENINCPEMHWLKTKILNDINKQSVALKMQLGEDVVQPSNQTIGKLTKLFGKEIGVPKANQEVKPFIESSFEVEAQELKLKADELYSKFLSTPTEQLVDAVSDLEIRAVAKKAGLPVTEESPAKITEAFVEQIKEAIQKQIEPNLEDNQESNSENNQEPESDKKIPTQEESELHQLKKVADKLYQEFDSIDNKAILDSYSDLEIRAVAKKAGLPVTEESPAKITTKFLNQIKEAIEKTEKIKDNGK